MVLLLLLRNSTLTNSLIELFIIINWLVEKKSLNRLILGLRKASVSAR